MALSSGDWHFLPVLLEWVEFLLLALLGYAFMQILHWEGAFRKHRARWLAKLRRDVRHLRTLRKLLEQTGGQLPQLPLPFPLRRKWQAVQWIGKAIHAAKLARS